MQFDIAQLDRDAYTKLKETVISYRASIIDELDPSECIPKAKVFNKKHSVSTMLDGQSSEY